MPTERHLWNRFSSTVLLVAVALLVPTPLRATLQQDQRLSWAEAVREAVDWHPSVTEAVARLHARTEEVTIAEDGYRPKLSGGIGSGFDNIIAIAGTAPPGSMVSTADRRGVVQGKSVAVRVNVGGG